MNQDLQIIEGGQRRLRKLIEAQVRQEFEKELMAAEDHWKKVEIEERISREIKSRMDRVSSPQSLWGAK